MQTPEFMPVLSGGCHTDVKDGACVMEYVAFITGGEHSDMPECTPRTLARLAQYVNDYQPDDVRSERLLPLMPRLIGEGQDPEFDRHLCNYLYHRGLESTRKVFILDNYRNVAPRGGAHHRWVRDIGAPGVLIAYVMGNVHMEEPHYAQGLVDLLIDCLDLYDRYLERETPTMSEDQTASVHRLAALIGG